MNNTLTLVQNKDSNRTIPLLTPPTDPVIDASCSILDNEIFFLSFHQSGETYLTRVNDNATTLIGRGILEHNIPPKIYHQRYTAVNNDSGSLVFDFNCVEPRVHVDHPHHLAVVVEARTTQKCECGADETSTELPTNGTNATETLNTTTETPSTVTETPSTVTETPSTTTETPSTVTETPTTTTETPSTTTETSSVTTETPSTTTETSSVTTVTPSATTETLAITTETPTASTDATTKVRVDVSNELLNGTTIGIVSFAMVFCLVAVMVVIGVSACVCVHR